MVPAYLGSGMFLISHMNRALSVSSQAHIQTPSFACCTAGISNKVQHTAVLQLLCDSAYVPFQCLAFIMNADESGYVFKDFHQGFCHTCVDPYPKRGLKRGFQVPDRPKYSMPITCAHLWYLSTGESDPYAERGVDCFSFSNLSRLSCT